MRRTEHSIARAIVVAGLLASLGYLSWRALYTLAGTDLWLSVPAILVEIAGFVGSALLAWALWPHPGSVPDATPSDELVADVSPVDVLVRVAHQGAHELRATLIALRSVAAVREVIVVHGGFADAVAAAGTSRVLLLDAGDVPTADIVTRLARAFVDERVAVVQGLGVSFAEDSIEHGPHGRHDFTFERGALNPALGSRGCAIWTGSGSLVSVDALREAIARGVVGDSPLATQWALSAEMLAAGWRIVAPADVAVVGLRVESIESVVHEDRRARVRAARALVRRCRGGFSWRQRMSILAWCVRPLSGLRRSAFIAVLVLALYAGSAPLALPVGASLSIVLAVWSTALIATSVGLGLLSGWRLRPGDRARWSLVSLEPIRNSMGLVVAMTAVTVVLLLRGISDQFTHTLGRLPQDTLMGLIIVALWTLAMSLDHVRLLTPRTRRRGSIRVSTLLPAILGDRSAKIIDLTPNGAGLLSQTANAVGERVLLVSTITTTSGINELQVPCVVHSAVAIDGKCWRIGVKFSDAEDGAIDDSVVNALVEYCTVEPTWARLGVMPATSVTEARRINYARESQDDEAFIGKGMLCFLSIVALAGAVASAVSRFDATKPNTTWLVPVVVSLAIGIAASLLLALITGSQALRSEPENSSSSLSPDLAIR
ncbi:MAG: hypothetical protein K8R99_02215 [Actinomycetia bacterium]|nr:hypothetical protein [Actinomycetes bacterium]